MRGSNQQLKNARVPDKGNKLLGIEILRFLCALAILFWHYQNFSYIADQPVNFTRNSQPFYGIFRIFYEFGGWGVKIFWCISGFIFFWKYRDLISQKIVDGRRFFILRFSRLYPLHAITLLFVAGIQLLYHWKQGYFFVYQLNNLPYFISQIFMASAWGFPNPSSFNGPIWSISAEVLVYFIFYICLRFISRSVLVNLCILGACFLLHRIKFTHASVDCLAFFYAGGISAIVSREISSNKFKNTVIIMAWTIVLLAPFAIWVFRLNEYRYFEYLLSFVYTPILLFCLSRDFKVSPNMHVAIEAFGNMTYSSYLLHFPVQLAIVTFLAYTKRPVLMYEPGLWIAFMSITLIASFLTYRLIEAPAQKWLRRRLK